MDGLRGTYAALLTGFSDDGAFCPERQRAITTYVATQNITGLYVGGSSGEDGLMETDELLAQQAVVAETVQETQIPLIAHVGRPSLRKSIFLAKSAEKNGYSAISALPPHAYPFSDAEVVSYYRALSQSSTLPLIVYEIPSRTQRALSNSLLTELMELPTTMGIKFTSTDLFKFSQLRQRHPQKVLFFGFDEIASTGALLGADGGIGTTYNVLGSLYSAMFEAMSSGSMSEAQRLQLISQKFVSLVVETGVMPGCKIALNAIGIDAGESREPFSIRSTKAAEQIRNFMRTEEVKRWTSTLRFRVPA